MGSSRGKVTVNRSFVIYLKNLDIEKEFDLYLKVLGSDGRTSNLIRLRLNSRGIRPAYDVTPTPEPTLTSAPPDYGVTPTPTYTPSIPDVRGSVVRGLDSPLKFTPNKYFQFLQYTSYGNLHEHHRTTFLLILYPENIPV